MNKITKTILIIAGVLVFAGVAEAKLLTVGSTGSDVVKLQTFLIDNGYTIPLIEKGVASKGYFGEQTENAVKMYQEDNETYPTGSIDSSAYGIKTNPIKLGAVAGPDSYFDYVANNDVQRYAERVSSLTQATTTVCAIKSPSATSSLMLGTFRLNTLATTTGPVILTLAKSSTAFATTTSLGFVTVQAGKAGEATATTTGAHIFSPNTFFVVGAQGSVGVAAGAGTFSLSGSCQADFLRL